LENEADVLEIFIGDGYIGSYQITNFSKKLKKLFLIKFQFG